MASRSRHKNRASICHEHRLQGTGMQGVLHKLHMMIEAPNLCFVDLPQDKGPE